MLLIKSLPTKQSSPQGAAQRAIAIALVSLSALCALTAATNAQALTLREMRTLELSDKQGKAFVQYYLIGVLEGVLEANAQSVRAGNKPLFCAEGRRLLPSMAKSIYDTEIKRNAELYEADMPAQLVMTNALVNAYTC